MKNKLQEIFIESDQGKFRLNQKVSIFLSCLLLSTFFWFLSVLSKNYDTTLTIPLEYTAFSSEFILTEEPTPYVELEVFGSGFELLGEQVSLNRNTVKVDISKARQLRKGVYGMSTSNLRNEILNTLDKDLSLRKIITDSLRFTAQKRANKKVELRANTRLIFTPGYSIRGELTIKPDHIVISGPQEEIDAIEYVETEIVSLDNVSDSSLVEVEIKLPKTAQDVILSEKKALLSIPVEKFTEKPLLIPIRTKIEVEGVKVKTYPDQLKAIVLVPLSKYEALQEDLLRASVVFNEESRDNKKLTVELEGVPPYAKLIRMEPNSVEFIVKK